MPDIKDTVGDGGKNKVHDVALVQAMLRLIKDAAGKPFLATNYDGVYGGDTKSAITRFQVEHKLITPDGKDRSRRPALDQVGGGDLSLRLHQRLAHWDA